MGNTDDVVRRVTVLSSVTILLGSTAARAAEMADAGTAIVKEAGQIAFEPRGITPEDTAVCLCVVHLILPQLPLKNCMLRAGQIAGKFRGIMPETSVRELVQEKDTFFVLRVTQLFRNCPCHKGMHLKTQRFVTHFSLDFFPSFTSDMTDCILFVIKACT